MCGNRLYTAMNVNRSSRGIYHKCDDDDTNILPRNDQQRDGNFCTGIQEFFQFVNIDHE